MSKPNSLTCGSTAIVNSVVSCTISMVTVSLDLISFDVYFCVNAGCVEADFFSNICVIVCLSQNRRNKISV